MSAQPISLFPAALNLPALVDELGAIRAAAADLKLREAAIREALIASGVRAVEGDDYRAAVAVQNRTVIDWRAIVAKCAPSHQLVSAHTTRTEVIAIRVSGRAK